jgi:hypothetical protein
VLSPGLTSNRSVDSELNRSGTASTVSAIEPFQGWGISIVLPVLRLAWIRSTLVFCDPDVGLEQDRAYSRKAPTKYLYFSEASAVWGRTTDSCLVIYQHLVPDARKRAEQTAEKAKRLQSELRVPVSTVRSEDVTFLVAGAEPSLLKHYAEKHGMIH